MDIYRICSTLSSTHVWSVKTAMSNILEDSQIRWFAKATRSNQMSKKSLYLKPCHMWGIYLCMCPFWPSTVMLPPPRRHRLPARHRSRPPAKPKNNLTIVTSSSDEYWLLIFINRPLKIIQRKYLPTIWHQSATKDRIKQKTLNFLVLFLRILQIGHRVWKRKEGTFKESVVRYASIVW